MTRPERRTPSSGAASPGPDDVMLVSCLRCAALHRATEPLSFNPVCPACAGSFPLGSLGMIGTLPLTHATIDEMVGRRSPGNYALGYLDGGVFMVFYVGRSDSDVGQRLHRWVGAPSLPAHFGSPARAPWGSRRSGARPFGSPDLRRVGACADSYTHFAYSYAPSPEAAFEKECRNFDDFGGNDALDNEGEPDSERS